jgi:hypothetical protein
MYAGKVQFLHLFLLELPHYWSSLRYFPPNIQIPPPQASSIKLCILYIAFYLLIVAARSLRALLYKVYKVYKNIFSQEVRLLAFSEPATRDK